MRLQIAKSAASLFHANFQPTLCVCEREMDRRVEFRLSVSFSRTRSLRFPILNFFLSFYTFSALFPFQYHMLSFQILFLRRSFLLFGESIEPISMAFVQRGETRITPAQIVPRNPFSHSPEAHFRSSEWVPLTPHPLSTLQEKTVRSRGLQCNYNPFSD